MALDGRVCLSLRPRGYGAECAAKWHVHAETARLNETIASAEAEAKRRRSEAGPRPRSDDNDDDDQLDDNDDDDDDLNSGDNRHGGHYATSDTDEKDKSTNDTDADMSNKFNVLTASNDY